MKIKRFTAISVHGYLDFDITFNTDLTFLIGINGSGKTSVLRLIQGLLGPILPVLYQQTFKKAKLICDDKGVEVIISVVVNEGGYPILTVSGVDEALTLPLINDPDGPNDEDFKKERFSRFYEETRNNEVIKRIQAISPPMLLGLDRRIYDGNNNNHERIYMERIYSNNQRARWLKGGTLSLSLLEIQDMTFYYIRQLRKRQDQLGEDLRKSIILSAFRYESLQFQFPQLDSEIGIRDLDRKRTKILEAAGSLGVKPQELDERIKPFFSRMEELAKKLATSKNKKDIPSVELIEWSINKPQVDRFDTLLKQIEDYYSNATKLFEPVDTFKEVLNLFLKDSGKELIVMPDGELAIKIGVTQSPKSIQALSSGERQILVLLAHLAFNPQAKSGGVFIVDEPELSLHLKWQELFVNAVQKIAPDMQIILATHSPSIVLDKGDKCVELSDRGKIS